MNHADHVNLLRNGVLIADAASSPGGAWADFGSGTGAFTLALANLLGPQGVVYSVDRDARALRAQAAVLRTQFPRTQVHVLTADFTRPLDLPPLDGVVMANSLHFVEPRCKESAVRLVKSYLRPGGRLILVEYNVDQGNLWVPHPLSYGTWELLARRCGFTETRLLATVPSRFLREMYSAVSW